MRMSWNNKAKKTSGDDERGAHEALLGALSLSEDVLAQISGGQGTMSYCHKHQAALLAAPTYL